MAMDLFTVGPGNNFHLLVEDFRDHIICFGDAADEILRGERIVYTEPKHDDVDDEGRSKYALQFHAATKDREERYGPELSDAGASALLSDKNFYRDQRTERIKNSRALVAYLLSRLSMASKTALSTLKGPDGFDACKAAVDSFGMWQLVLKIHLYGSARTKQRFMIDLFSVKQAGSHESYVNDVTMKAKLVVGAFESLSRPGYIKTDDLVKVVYMNGLDQVVFERCISKLIEDLPKATAEEAMQLCQEFSLDRGHSVSSAAASFSGKVFATGDLIVAAADASPALRKSGRASNPNYIPNLPAWPVNSKWCSYCWSRGFKNEHAQSVCGFYQRSLARLPRADLRPSASDLRPSAHVAGHTLASDRLLIEKYESDYHSNYVSAYDRVVAGADSYVALAVSGPFLSSLEDSFAFAAVNSSVSWWYDNCASVSVVDVLRKLVDHESLPIPFRIGGIIGGITVTHRGYIPFLPRSIGLAYFSSEATACLISLGYVQSQGGSYRSLGLSKLVVRAPGGIVIDIADIGSNRLTAVSSRLLSVVVSPSGASSRVIDPVVRSRPLPFRLSTRASGPVSLVSRPSLHASHGLCLTSVAPPLSGALVSGVSQSSVAPPLSGALVSGVSQYSLRVSGPLPLLSRLPLRVPDDLPASVLRCSSLAPFSCSSLQGVSLYSVRASGPLPLMSRLPLCPPDDPLSLPCHSDIEDLSSKFLRAREAFRSLSAHAHLCLPLVSDFPLGLSCDGVAGDFKHVCAALSQEQYIELARFVADYEALPRSAVQAFAFPAFAHFNAEQRDRCDRAEKVHQLSHISDDLICESLSNGGYRWANITPADVRLNRTLRGRCPQCAEAKHHAKPMPPSLTAPATCVGECISIDLHALRVKSKGGNTVSIHSLDEYSGDHQITPAVSMRSVSIFDAIMSFVHRRYNAYGHAVKHIVADSDPVLLPLVDMLGMMGILLSFCPPGQHAQRVERTIGFSDRRKGAVLASLPYYLPLEFDIYADAWVADSANQNPNSRSRPSTSDIIVTGQRRPDHYKFPGLQFGDVCLVTEFLEKRRREAKEIDMPLKRVPHAELGVCLGNSREVPGAFDFVVGNGSIFPRRVVEIVQVHPFDWKRKSVLRAELRLPVVEPVALPQGSVQGRSGLPDAGVVSDVVLPLLPSPFIGNGGSGAVLPDTSVQPGLLLPDRIVDAVVVNVLPASNDSVVLREHDVPVPILADIQHVPVPVVESDVCVPAVVNVPSNSDRVMREKSSRSKPDGFWSGSSSRAGAHALIDQDGYVTPKKAVPLSYAQTVYASRVSGRPCPKLISFPVRSCSLVAEIVPLLSSTSLPLSKRKFYRSVLSDALTESDRLLISQSIKDDIVAAAAVNAHWGYAFDTKRDDEFDIVEAVAYLSQASTVDYNSYLEDSPCVSVSRAFAVNISPIASVDLLPIPSDKCKEIPLRQARRDGDLARLEKSTEIEISKQMRIGALGDVFESDVGLPVGSIVVDAHVLYKLKADNRDTCRIAIMGNRLPKEPMSKTFASVVSDGAKMFSLSAMQAHCSSRSEELIVSDADVVGGFLHIPLNSPVPMFVRMPKNLPHPLAGKLVRILAAIYGLQESNRLFSLELSRVIVEDAKFVCTSVEKQVFVKHLENDFEKQCVTCVTVDDALVMSNDQSLIDDLFSALTRRFGPLTINKVCTVHTGLELTRYPNGAILVTQDRAIARAASVIGVSHLPPVAVPVALDFFHSSVDPLLSVCVDATVYSSLTGKLVQFLKTRHEIRQFISYLCSFNSAPLECHYRQAIHILRYLVSTPGMGCVFQYSGPVVIVAASDSACGIFPDGRSSSAHIISVGPDNAPFICSGKAQEPVATCPMTAEYYAAGASCSDIIHYRQLASDLGWPQVESTVLCLDNKTALALAVAPEVSKKSKHIFIKYHNIRWLVSIKVISLKYVPTKQMRANVLTKALSKTMFLLERDVLFNRLVIRST